MHISYVFRGRGLKVSFDPRKGATNQRKHGIELADAEIVLYDPMTLVREDGDAEGEQRFVAVGSDAQGRILTVVYTYRSPDTIRLISARPATRKEREAYED